ncbi:MAG TPA: hypothetical protein VII12_18580 [Thermoanaerobaculia bacterium]|jgi:hypothetical protein
MSAYLFFATRIARGSSDANEIDLPRGASLLVRHRMCAAVNRPLKAGERYHSPMVKANEQYEDTIAEIDKAIGQAGERINGLNNNLSRAINVLSSVHPHGLASPERDVLLAFEALCVQSLWRTAWLFHERGEHDQARQCLEVGRMLQDTVLHATEQ